MKVISQIKKGVIVIAGYLCPVIMAVIIGYALWLLSRVFLFDQVITPTESMIPTLLHGDRIIVDKTVVEARIPCYK